MSMFRRPTDDSSDSGSSSEASDTEELDHSNAGTDHSNAGTEEIIGADLTTAGTLSSGESISIDHSRDETNIGDVDHVRNMMLASLLEDFYKTRAVELFKTAHPGTNFDRESPAIQPLARNLFAQASQALISNGLLPASVVSNDVQNVRGQYLAGFDTFGLHNVQEGDLLTSTVNHQTSALDNNSMALVRARSLAIPEVASSIDHPMHDLALRAERLSVVSHPANDMKLSTIQSPRSHYKSSFQEMRLLGRGGFGRVYQTYNVFDQKEYAVKKIPLSIKLSQQYREKGHSELASILREVQALAQLDHCNVVRYHATWIEDPTIPFTAPDPPIFRSPFNRQKLLADKPTFSPQPQTRRRSSSKLLSYGISDGITFEADSTDEAAAQHQELEWSYHSHVRPREPSLPDSDIFTDGMPHKKLSDKVIDDPSCYVLHVQMSMYPTTLAQYLSPGNSNPTDSPGKLNRRHCFHLVPAVRILLGILYGLQYIHARGLVHRDIKPSNIFLSSYEIESQMYSPEGYYNVGACPSCPARKSHFVNPRIGDFGLVADLARDCEYSLGSTSSSSGPVGTEYYRPPIGNGKRSAQIIDEKLDVYALGIVLVEMLWSCGTSMERMNLLKNLQNGILSEDLIQMIEAEGHCPSIGAMVRDCIEGMIAKDHALRWNCSKVRKHLEDILAECLVKWQGTG